MAHAYHSPTCFCPSTWIFRQGGKKNSLLLSRFEFLQPDLGGDVAEFLMAHLLQSFAARLELFVDLDGFLGHHRVGFLRAADQREILALGDALMAVGIQPEAEDRS